MSKPNYEADLEFIKALRTAAERYNEAAKAARIAGLEVETELTGDWIINPVMKRRIKG